LQNILQLLFEVCLIKKYPVEHQPVHIEYENYGINEITEVLT